MAFGFSMRVEWEGMGITLRPPTKEEVGEFAEYLANGEGVRYTNMWHAPTTADEEEWWEKTRKDSTGIHWAIVPDGCDRPVGRTGLHKIDLISRKCTSGILILNPEWRGRRVGTLAHLARTLYVVKLNLCTIQSQVREPNIASRKALERMGYRVSGQYDCDVFVDGRWVNTLQMSWINPAYVGIMFPDGTPEYLAESLEKARAALKLARQVVTML